MARFTATLSGAVWGISGERSINNFNRRRHILLVAVTTLMMVGGMFHSFYTGRNMLQHYAPLVNAAMKIKLQTTTAHLWFEEIISGDQYISIESVWKHLDQAEWYARAMLEGGQSKDGEIIPLDDPGFRLEIEKTLKGLSAFRAIAQQRWDSRSQSGVGTDIDQRLDKTFNNFLAYADDVETALKRTMNRQSRQFVNLQGSLIIVTVILGAFIGILFQRYERRRTSDFLELRDREEYFRTTLNSIGDAVITTDTSGNLIHMNPVAEELTGWDEREAAGRSLAEVFRIVNAKTREPAVNPIEQVLKSGWIVGLANHTILTARDGTERQIADSAAPIRDAEGNISGVVLVFRDVTENYAMREALEESEQRLAASIDNMAVGTIVIKDDGVIVEFNPFAENLFGYEAAEVIGKNIEMLMPEPHRSDHDQYLRSYLDTGEKKIIGIGREVEGLRKSGETFTVRLGVGEIKTDEGSFFVGSVIDLTEVKSLEVQLRQAQKMEAVGHLTGGISHDFNNLLGIVMGNLELLQCEVANEPRISDRIQKALRGAERGASLTRKLLGFSRRSATRTKLINVNEFIENLHQLIAKSLTPSVEVQHHLASDLWSVVIDPEDFENAILNLALNARDAMPDGGEMIIETANKILDEEYVKRNPQGRAGKFMMISVSDTGTGMTDEVRAKAFEPFYTTKDRDKGTGLGLSMVYGFVQRSGGHLKICSEAGAGTTVRIYIPRADEEITGDEEPSKIADSLPGGSETILVVDDEEDLVDVAVAHLEGLGYRTLSATDGKQAVKILEDNPDIDLLFTDVIMPGRLGGYELTLVALKIRPGLKVLLVSGFTRECGKSVNRDNAVFARLENNLLGKPYNRTELACAIRRTLDEKNDDETCHRQGEPD